MQCNKFPTLSIIGGQSTYNFLRLYFNIILKHSLYFRGYASSKEGANGGSYGSTNNKTNDSGYEDGNNNSNRWSSNSYGYGMMGGYGGMMGGNWGSGINQNTNNSLSEDEANKDMEDYSKTKGLHSQI